MSNAEVLTTAIVGLLDSFYGVYRGNFSLGFDIASRAAISNLRYSLLYFKSPPVKVPEAPFNLLSAPKKSLFGIFLANYPL